MSKLDRLYKYSTCLIIIIAIEIVVLNLVLPYPDNNDFYELSRICLLMDSNVKYCVNNNWGFAHPLSCWLLTKWTNDIFISQRMISAGFMLLLIFSFLKLLSISKIFLSRQLVFICAFLLASPWIVELMISVHMDIAPIALVFAGILLRVRFNSNLALLFLAAILVGSSYWFRFHFLSFAMLFPVFSYFYGVDNSKRWKMLLVTISGVFISIALPHILCSLVYNKFSVSNEKIVLAQALGIADWSYEFAQKLETLTLPEMLKDVNWLFIVVKYCYNFIKSGILPFFLIYGVLLFDFIKKYRNQNAANSKNNYNFNFLLIATYAMIAVVPFTVIRGFTYRLEAAFILFIFPLIIWAFTNLSKKGQRIIIATLLILVTYQQIIYWKQLIINRTLLAHYSNVISENIPLTFLKNSPEEIISCVDYYNPNNKYRLCNPMVFAGWGVRFLPFIEKFGFLNMENPYGNSIYVNAKYIILPTIPGYFKYSSDLLSKNKIVFKDNFLCILKKGF